MMSVPDKARANDGFCGEGLLPDGAPDRIKVPALDQGVSLSAPGRAETSRLPEPGDPIEVAASAAASGRVPAYPSGRPSRRVRAWGTVASVAIAAVAIIRVITANFGGWASYNAGGNWYELMEVTNTLVVLGLTNSGALAVAGVLFLVWLHRARINAETIAPEELRLSRGWSIGGWFVPIANLVLAPMAVADVWRASAPVTRRRTGLVIVWWMTVLTAWALNYVAAASRHIGLTGQEWLDSLYAVAVWHSIESVFTIAAAGLIVAIILRVSRWQEAPRIAGREASTTGIAPGHRPPVDRRIDAIRVGRLELLWREDPVELGPFRLIARLGSGGMGAVFLGRDTCGQLAAVKVLHPALAADATFRARFVRETETVGRITAPGVARLVAAEPHDATPWLATEFVMGPSLSQAVLACGPLPPSALGALARGMAIGLAGLHAVGVVHRDIKPSNVILTAAGPMLIDLGVARAADATQITRTGAVVGPPGYMSPEQASGDAIGPPSDVFSLASVLVFAATGEGPFGQTDNAVAMLRRITMEAAETAGLPDALRAQLAGSFAKDPDQRPTAEELANRLASHDGAPWPPPAVTSLISQVEQDVAEHTQPPPQAWTPPTTQPGRGRLAWLIVASVLAGLVLLGWLLVTALSGRNDRSTASGPAPAVSAPPPPSPPSQPAPSGPPPPVVNFGLVPSQRPGWLAAVSTIRNAAYDVPPSWRVSSPGLVFGFSPDDGRGKTVKITGMARYLEQPCPAIGRSIYRAFSGVSGHTSGNLSLAATETAQQWKLAYQPDDSRPPVVRLGAPRPVAVGGEGGIWVTATLDMPSQPCLPPRAAVHAVAVPGNRGQSVVLVIVTDLDVPDAVREDDIATIIGTLRPAGLAQQCERGIPGGSWC